MIFTLLLGLPLVWDVLFDPTTELWDKDLSFKGVPQYLQNFAEFKFSLLQLGHLILSPLLKLYKI